MRSPLRVAALGAAASLVVSLLIAPAALGGTAVRLGVPELAERADLIVEARVLSTRVVEAPGTLQTEAVLQVGRTFAGQALTYRTVRLPGGEREDGSGLLIPGMPRLAAGEDVLLFLSAEGKKGARMPIGLSQGKLGVVTLASGAKRLTRDATDTNLVGGGGAGAARGLLDYAEVVAQIEAGLARKAAGR